MRLRSYTGSLLAILVFVASWAWLYSGVRVGEGGDDWPPFHPDESHKLGEAFYYHLMFEQRDPANPTWSEDFYARVNPPVGKYILGAAMAAAGRPIRDRQHQTDFENHWQAPKELRKLVPDEALRVTRRTSILFGAGVCMLLFLAGRRAAGTAAGLIAAALMLGNTSFAENVQRGLTDSILLFHMALILPVTMVAIGVFERHWHGDPADRTVWRWSVLVAATAVLPGVVIALAAGTKLNGALTGPAYAAGLLGVALLGTASAPRWRRVAVASAATCLAAVTAVAVFIAINPYYYRQPFSRMASTMTAWQDWMITQQILPGPGLFTLRQKIAAAGQYSLADSTLPLFRLLEGAGLGTAGAKLAILGFAVGLVTLVGRCVPAARDDGPDTRVDPADERRRADAMATLAWVIVCTVGITAWLPVLIDRHLLPPYLMIGLTTAVGLAALPRAARSLAGLFGGENRPPNRRLLVAGAAATTAMWIVLAFTSWVISPMLLQDPRTWTDPDALEKAADSHQLHCNAGVMFLQLGMNGQAADEFATALALLDRDAAGRISSLPQRCSILYGLVHARVAHWDRPGAIDALQQLIADLEKLRAGIKSDDPYVRAAFDKQITDNRARLAKLISP